MKRSAHKGKGLLLSGLTLSLFSQVFGQAVYSVNVVGFKRVIANGQDDKQSLTASPFKQGANTLDELVGTQADENADSIILYDGGKFRKCIRLAAGVAGHEDKAGRWVDAATYELITTGVGPGKGMIFKDRNPTVNKDLVFVGEVINEPTIDIPLPGAGKFSLLSYPYSTDRDLNTHPLQGASAFLGDQAQGGEKIYLFDKATQLYTVCVYDAAQSKWVDPKTKAPAAKSIKTGESFFFVSNAGAPADRTSTEAIPYDLSAP